MADISHGLVFVQRVQVVATGDPLGELPEVVAGQQLAKFGLADKNDLQQFLLGSFKVGQQANLLQYFGAEVLSLVDDQYHPAAPGMGIQQASIQGVDHFLGAGLFRYLGAQLVTNGMQELIGGKAWVENQRHFYVAGDLLKQAANQGGFPGTHLAGELHEASALSYPVQQMGQRFSMALGQVQVPGVRSD